MTVQEGQSHPCGAGDAAGAFQEFLIEAHISVNLSVTPFGQDDLID